MDISAVRQGIADNAGTISGLRTFAYAPDLVSPPVFFVAEVDITFDQTFGRGMDELRFTCRVLVNHANDRTGQQALDAYLAGSGASSLKAAIEADRTLGGSADDCRVQSIGNYGAYEHNGVVYYGAEVIVQVIGEG